MVSALLRIIYTLYRAFCEAMAVIMALNRAVWKAVVMGFPRLHRHFSGFGESFGESLNGSKGHGLALGIMQTATQGTQPITTGRDGGGVTRD